MDTVFQRSVDADDVTKVESLCMSCYKDGTTSLLFFEVPHFRQLLISSFDCPHCGYHNREVKAAGDIQDRGCRFKLTVVEQRDLLREVVISEYAILHIPSLQLEVPRKRSQLTTIEGLIQQISTDLSFDQEARREAAPEVADKIDVILKKLTDMVHLEEQFEITVDDPSGNSYVENPQAPKPDPQLVVTHYNRTAEQDTAVGIIAATQDGPAENDDDAEDGESADVMEKMKGEVSVFKSDCPSCQAPAETRMKLVDIPLFKEVVIMALACEECGFKDNEVKGASGIADKGKRFIVDISEQLDLSRDVLKSDTAALFIPELDIELGMGTLGGKFTTVEGILLNVADGMGTLIPFADGDSQLPAKKQRLTDLSDKIREVVKKDCPGIHLILDDIAGNSYVQDICHPDPDPRLTVEEYDRTEEQNEALGLLDMKTEGYDQSAAAMEPLVEEPGEEGESGATGDSLKSAAEESAS